MSFRVRTSKFRHVFGQPVKKDECYDNIRVSKSSWDSTFCACNPKFLAVIVECGGGGGFFVTPLKHKGRQPPDAPIVAGHKGAVLDIAWNPFNDNVIASASEDCMVKVWEIPDLGLTRTLDEPIAELRLHQRRVGLIVWHPAANNILMSAGCDNKVVIWNVGTSDPMVIIDSIPDQVLSACWSWDGSKLLTTCRDRQLRVMDPRTGEVLDQCEPHDGTKATRCIVTKSNQVFTTGFSKRSQRQYSLRPLDDLANPLVVNELDTSNGVIFPVYDADTNMIYLCGKGDSVIRFFEVTSEAPFVHYLSTYQANDPQRAIGVMPKRGCDTKCCEIFRFYRVNNTGTVQVIPMVVPRKSELFQEDLYPDTVSDVAAITAEEWQEGTDAEPTLISMKGGIVAPSVKKGLIKIGKKTTTNKVLRKQPSQSTDGGGEISQDQLKKIVDKAVADALKAQEKQCEDLQLDITKLKALIVRHDGRLKQLEGQQQNGAAPAVTLTVTPPADQTMESDEV